MSDLIGLPVLGRNVGGVRAEDGRGPSQAGNEQAWRRELERAQWEQRTAVATGEVQASGARAEEETGGRGAMRHSAQPGRAPIESGSPSTQERRAGDGSSASRFPGGPMIGRAQDHAALPSPVPGVVLESGATSIAKRSVALQAAIATRLWGEARRWERRRALVIERDGRVSIWIRDAEHMEADTAGVVSALLNLVREAGMAADQVTINGRVVFDNATTVVDSAAQADR